MVDTTTNAVVVQKFVVEYIAPWMDGVSDVLIFDGASHHLTQDVLNTISTATGDRYKKVPAYAHHLSPVEREFANVWRSIRQLWAQESKKNPREKVQPTSTIRLLHV